MSIELKVKAKSLAAEARIIRKEERKQIGYGRYLVRIQSNHDEPYRRYNSLYEHRVNVVRPAARATHLARAVIKGTPYKMVENKVREPIDLNTIKRVADMVSRYSKVQQEVALELVKAWAVT